MMDLGPHCLDLIQFVLGRKVWKIHASLMNTQTFAYEVEDSASLLLELEGGIHATLSIHFNLPGDIAANRLEIYGTEGALVLEGTLGQVERGRLLLREKGAQFNEVEVHDSRGLDAEMGLYISELQHFVELMGNESCWMSVMEEQLQLQALLDEAYRLGE